MRFSCLCLQPVLAAFKEQEVALAARVAQLPLAVWLDPLCVHV